MKIVWVLALIGFNALAYSALVGFCFGPDETFTKHPKLRDFFIPVLFVLSIPGVFAFEPAFNAHGRRIYDYELSQKRAVRAVAEKHGKPPALDVSIYKWDVDLYTDADGHFDLYGWKSHEYDKLGL